MKKNLALFSIVILFCGTLGCKRDSSVQPRSDTITIKKACHDISDFKKSLADLDVLSIQNWVIEESLSNAFLSVGDKQVGKGCAVECGREGDFGHAICECRCEKMPLPVFVRCESLFRRAGFILELC